MHLLQVVDVVHHLGLAGGITFPRVRPALVTLSLVFTGGPYTLTSFLFPRSIGLLLWFFSAGRVTLRGWWDYRYRVLALLVRSGFPAPWTWGGGGDLRGDPHLGDRLSPAQPTNREHLFN